MENFVITLLKIAWPNQDPPVVAAYRNFLANLVTAQGYYVKPVVRMLISNFIGFADRQTIQNSQSFDDDDALTSNMDQVQTSFSRLLSHCFSIQLKAKPIYIAVYLYALKIT